MTPHCARWLEAPLSAALLVALLGGCAAPPPASVPTPGEATRYAYVVLGEEGRPVARVIASPAVCPAIEIDGVAQAMDVRAVPATIPLRPTLNAVTDSKPSAFPVLTCEKVLPAGVKHALIDGKPLPLPGREVHRIVVIGDTGCRMKAAERIFQGCNNTALWPFAGVAKLAAAEAPDLVVHVGDYHYRETACPPGNPGCAGSPWGYGWDAWEADFFAPAAPLLAAAPWIVVRGNHESCNRAGQGWWRFLDPRPLSARQDCNAAADDAIGDYSEPYAVPLGTGPDADTQFVVFDSSLVGVTPLPPTDPMHVKYKAQFERAFALAARKPGTFFTNHHPILAFAPNPQRPDTPWPGNGALQSVLSPMYSAALFPANVQALFSGHVHLFEVASFATPQPVQFVSGNAGDWVDVPLALPLPAGSTPSPGAQMAMLVATNRFGFMTMERDGSDWKIVAFDSNGATMISCVLRARQASCEPSIPVR